MKGTLKGSTNGMVALVVTPSDKKACIDAAEGRITLVGSKTAAELTRAYLAEYDAHDDRYYETPDDYKFKLKSGSTDTYVVVPASEADDPETYDPGRTEATCSTAEEARAKAEAINAAIAAGTAEIACPDAITDAAAITAYKALSAAKVIEAKGESGSTYEVKIDFTDTAAASPLVR